MDDSTALYELNEDKVPESDPICEVKFDAEKHTADTRRMLALASLAVLVVFYGVILTAFLSRVATLQELAAVIAAFGGVQTLAAVAFGFYLAKSH